MSFFIDFSALLQNDEITAMDRNVLQRNTELVADVVEAVLQKTSRIVLIEDTTTSVKVRTSLPSKQPTNCMIDVSFFF